MKVKNITSLTNKKTMTITLISILILSAMLGATAYAVDGSGTCTVLPITVVAGSTENTLTFTFTATDVMDGGAIAIAIPAGWSAPQGTSGTAGYTTATSTGTIGAIMFASQVVTVPITALAIAETITVVYGDGGGASGAVVQTTTGTATFTTQSKITGAGTLTDILTSPTVTVIPAALDYFIIGGGLASCIAHTDWAANNVIVTAYDVHTNLKTDYLGTVVWSSSDPVADLPATYSFTSGDSGSHTFLGTAFTMKTVGAQDIDVADGPISASTTLPTVVAARPVTVALDEAYYKTGDSVVVTVIDDVANERPLVAETIEVDAISPYPDIIYVTLTETGTASGEFVGSFTLVGAAPGANDLLVEDGDIIDVAYLTAIPPVVHATIDDSSPTVEIIEPANEDLISDYAPDIRANVADVGSGVASAIMKLDGVMVDSIIAAGEMLYSVPEYPEEMRLSEGLHIVVVTASDKVGNSAIEIWSFTVDLVEPTVSVEVDPDPAGIGDVTFTLTFNEDMDTGISPVVQFGTIDPYITHTASGLWTTDSLREWVGTYPLTGAEVEGLNTISVSVAEDKAGKAMETDTSNTFVIDTTDPTVPADLVATVTDVSVTLDWTASTDVGGTGVKEYEIERDTELIATVSHPVTTYVDYSLTEGPHSYTVSAVDLAGNKAMSLPVDVDFEPGAVIATEVPLSEGWNMMSLPLMPEDSSVTSVLSDVLANVDIVWSYDAATLDWSSYKLGAPSDLTDMVDGAGYWVKMVSEDTMIVRGRVMPEPPAMPPTYDVVEGWNLIGFKSLTEMPCTEYLAGIDGKYVRIWEFYEGAYRARLFGDTPDLMLPGHGYWIAMTESGTIYP